MNTKPKIILSTTDAERLERLLDLSPSANFPGKTELLAELERADVVAPEAIPPDVVTMNSTVKFTVSSSNEAFNLTLVYPKDVDDSGTTVSILAPVGSALLGLSKGDEIEWSKPGGGTISVRIDEIVYQPERSGAFHR